MRPTFAKATAGKKAALAIALAYCASSSFQAGELKLSPTTDQTPVANSIQSMPGELIVQHPTLINLGFEWHITGDANRNASVNVSFRKQGDTAWRKGLPLLRLNGEQTFAPNTWNLVAPNAFMGSILDLEPNTAYEVRMVMSDPDGVSGPAVNATKTATVRTRPVPVPAEGGQTYHVYPVKWKGPKIEPSVEGIMCAYN